MKKRIFLCLICAAALLQLGTAVLASGEDAGFYHIGEAEGVEICPVAASGEAVSGVGRDVDGDGEEDVFFPGSRALLVTLADTAEEAVYLLTVSSSEKTLYVDQRTGGGALSFRAAFALPDDPAELALEIGSTEAGFEKLAVTLFYTPSAAQERERLPGCASCGRDGDCPMRAFADLDPSAWYHDGVHYVLENGIMNGVEEGRFNPSGPASRGMIVTVLWRLEGMPEAESASFGDVPPDAWYAKAVSWAASERIVEGYGAERFGPNDNVSREQLAVILGRYAKHRGAEAPGEENTSLGVFIDAEHISPWAYEEMQWAVNAGLISGTGGERLSPKGDADRAQTATILMRLCRLCRINADA